MVCFKKFFHSFVTMSCHSSIRRVFPLPLLFFPLLTLLLLRTTKDSIFYSTCFNPLLFSVFLVLGLSQIEPVKASSNQDTTSLVFEYLLALWCKTFQTHLIFFSALGLEPATSPKESWFLSAWNGISINTVYALGLLIASGIIIVSRPFQCREPGISF